MGGSSSKGEDQQVMVQKNQPVPPRTPSNHRKVPARDIGARAPRECTNCLALILFFLLWGLMGYVAKISYEKGNIEALIYGRDFDGNVCGQGSVEGVPDWSSRTNLWYPLVFDVRSATFNLKNALKMGVCVSSCPTVNDASSLFLYGNSANNQNLYLYNGYGCPGTQTSCVRFNSVNTFHRCIPNMFTYMCNYSLPLAQTAMCLNANRSSTKVIQQLDGIFDGLSDGFAEVKSKWWVILVAAIITIVVCFLWLFVLRRLVKPMVVITLILTLVAIGILGLLLFEHSKDLESSGSSDDASSSKYYFYGAIVAWAVDFIALCVIIFLGKDIMVACDIIEEASKIPLQAPTMLLVPALMVLLILPFVFFGMFTSATIYTASSSLNESLPVPQVNLNDLPNSTVTLKSYTFENWRVYAAIYNLFMFLWSVGFIGAFGYFTLSYVAVCWYWSNPGDKKEVGENGVARGMKTALRYHMGTLALGSLVIAVLQIMRVILALFENQMRNSAQRTEGLKFLIRCAECCLAYFERLIKYINKNAYILCSMTGEPFLPAAQHALSLLLHNILSVGAVTVVGEYVMLFGKVLITGIITIITYGIMTKANGDAGVGGNGVIIIIVCAILAFFITCLFINIFGVCIDCVLLSYCYDLEQNNGSDRPYYFPSDLAKHVDRARSRANPSLSEAEKASLEKPLAK